MAHRKKTEWVLDELCARLGFCLSHEQRAPLEANPPREVEAFVDAVFIAEGLDPQDKQNRSLRREVRDIILRHKWAENHA